MSAASQLSPAQQKKYLAGLTGAAREARAREILQRRKKRSDKPFKTDEGRPTKRSKHAVAFERKYGRAPKDTADAARLSHVPKKILDEVYARGMAAWQTGHRPGAGQHAWAMARVESFLTGGATSRTADADLAREAKLKKRNPPPPFGPPDPRIFARAGYQFDSIEDLAEAMYPRLDDSFRAEIPLEKWVASAKGLWRFLVEDHEVWGSFTPGQPYVFRNLTNNEAGNLAGAFALSLLPKSSKVQAPDTPEFKRWFGKSKVVDAQGKPLAVYHGTGRGGFTKFDLGEIDAHHNGFFFTDSPAMASSYSGGKEDDVLVSGGQGIYTVFLSFQNPLEIDARGAQWDQISLEAVRSTLSQKQLDEAIANGIPLHLHWGALKTDDVSGAAKFLGYDGVIIRNLVDYGGWVGSNAPADVFIAFKPEQIKSANHNKGTFDPHDADIRNPAPTALNIESLHSLFGGADRVPNQIPASNVPHIRRCLDAGLLTVEDKGKTLVLTAAGIAALAPLRGRKNPPDPAYSEQAGKGSFSTAYSKPDRSAVELLTESRTYGTNAPVIDASKMVLALARSMFKNDPAALAMLPAVEPLRYTTAGGKTELVFWSPHYDILGARRSAWPAGARKPESIGRIAGALQTLYNLSPATVASARARLQAEDYALFDKMVSILQALAGLLEQLNAQEKLMFRLDLRSDNLATDEQGNLILLDPLVVQMPVKRALALWQAMGWPANAHRNPAPRVGKLIGGDLYVHKSALHTLPAEVQARVRAARVPFDWAIAKWNAKAGKLSLIESQDWDTADEPTVGRVFSVDTGKVIQPLADPWIYHHKWQFVEPTYQGFDVEASKARSAAWTALPDVDKSRIGKKSYWEREVLPRLNPDDTDLWTVMPQTYSSARTSINATRLPATFSRVSWRPGTRNADIGGGRFDNATEYLAGLGVENVIYDPYNRTMEWNEAAAMKIANHQADTVTVNNVLNVIAEEAVRDHVIEQAANALKYNGTAYFLIYTGNESGKGARSQEDAWQNNRKAREYVPEVAEHFGQVQVRDNLIIAQQPLVPNPSHIPPAPVAAAARRGLEMRAAEPPSNRCCTPVGLRRAAQLANRQPVSEDTMRRMLSYFERHKVDKQGAGWSGSSKGKQAWLCWGGDEGYAWVRRTLGV